MGKKDLAIIIVNWNNYSDTADCLLSLRALAYMQFDIILVDNGSEDGSGQKLKKDFDEVILLENASNEGFTGGNNIGMAYALKQGYAYLMLLNNDTIVTPDFVQPLLNTFDEQVEVGAVQPKILLEAQRDIIWNAGSGFNLWGFYPFTRGQGKRDSAIGNEVASVPWLTGCCFLIKSEVIREVGSLDDQFFAYYEDTDWSIRIRKAGYHLYYQPASKIYHKVGRSHRNRSGEGEGTLSPFAHYITVRNHIYVLRKHAKGIYVITGWLYQCVKLLAYLGYFLLRGRFKKMKATAKGVSDGLKPLSGKAIKQL